MKVHTTKLMAAGVATLIGAGALTSVAFAQSSSSMAPTAANRPVPSQACVSAMATQHETMMADMDAMQAAHKTIQQNFTAALKAAAQISDDTARAEALKAAKQAMADAMKAQMESKKDDRQSAMDALKAACGDSMPMMKMGMGHGKGGMFMKKMFKGNHMMKMSPESEMPVQQ